LIESKSVKVLFILKISMNPLSHKDMKDKCLYDRIQMREKNILVRCFYLLA